MTSKIYTAQEAVGEAWASIDGKLDEFRSANQTVMEGWRDGYLSDAESLIERAAKRGWVLVPAGREDALTEEVERLRAALTFGVKLYGMDGPAYWPVDDRIRFDELARAALKGKDQ